MPAQFLLQGSYDIRDDSRRNKVHKTLRDYAVPIQYSVFECRLNKENVITLKYKLEKFIRSSEDSIIFYRLCPRCVNTVKRIGASLDLIGDGIYIISDFEE